MRVLAKEEIRGNWATLLLPIAVDDSIDWDLLEEEIDRLIGANVDGIYSNGTAGEFFTQTEEEFAHVCRVLADRCERATMPFQLGASHMSPQTMLRRVAVAASFAPSAIQVILPDWFPVTNEEAADYLNAAAVQAHGAGLVLYDPPHAKRALNSDDMLFLLDRVPGLVGFKLPDGDEAWYEAMQPVMRRASVFIPGHHLATGLSRGASGAYSNVSCLSPVQGQKWTDMMQTDLRGALALEVEIRSFWEGEMGALITRRHFSNFAVDKFAAAVGGWTPITSRVRFPYRSIPMEEAEILREKLPERLPGFLAL